MKIKYNELEEMKSLGLKIMCLEIIYKKLTNELKSIKEDIIVYKIIRINNKSIFRRVEWKPGLNRSDRISTELSEDELKDNKIYKGFHFFREKPKECSFSDSCNNYHHSFFDNLILLDCGFSKKSCKFNKTIKLKIKPEDIVAVGKGSLNTADIVATKATWVEDET